MKDYELKAKELANDLNPIKDVQCPRDIKNAGLYFGYIKGYEAAIYDIINKTMDIKCPEDLTVGEFLSGVSSTKRTVE